VKGVLWRVQGWIALLTQSPTFQVSYAGGAELFSAVASRGIITPFTTHRKYRLSY
jgi:hypothetical protein